MRPRNVDELLALPRGQPAPDVPGGQRKTERAVPSRQEAGAASHAGILAQALVAVRLVSVRVAVAVPVRVFVSIPLTVAMPVRLTGRIATVAATVSGTVSGRRRRGRRG